LGALLRVEEPDQAGAGRIQERRAFSSAAAGAVGGGLHHVADRVGAGEDRERSAAGHSSERRGFPSADDAVENAAGVAQPLLALAERQFDQRVPLERMTAIEIGRCVVQTAIVDVERSVGSGGGVDRPYYGNGRIE